MFLETLALTALESALLFVLVWIVFRMLPAIPPNMKVWTWRLAFLKPLVGLLPLAAISLHVLAPAAKPIIAVSPVPISSRLPIHFPVSELELPPPTRSSPSANPLLVLWGMGAVTVAGYGVYGWFRAQRFVQRADPIGSTALHKMLDGIVLRVGLTKTIQLLSSSEIESPILVVGRKITILLPRSAEHLDVLDDVRMMLAHEVAHLVRRDLIWFGLIWLVQALFFFNPLVWLAAYSARLDHESATDRDAALLAEVPIQTYGDMLLRATVVARGSLAPGIVPMAESYRSIHRRLEAMKQFKRNPSPLAKSAALTLAFVTVAVLPLYRLAEAAPFQLGREKTQETLIFSVPKSAKNPFKYSVFKIGDNLWIQIEKDGRLRRYLWDADAIPNPSFSKVQRSKGMTDLIDCDFNNTDVRQALREVFRVTGHSFTIAPNVQGNVTMSSRNVDPETTLKNMLRQVNAEFRVINGVYTITTGEPEVKP